MSLDMTVAARQAMLDSLDEEIEAQDALATQLRLQQLMVGAGTALGVAISSALTVLLFLR